jgi:hypothetical protein
MDYGMFSRRTVDPSRFTFLGESQWEIKSTERTKAHHSVCNCITREDLRCAGHLQLNGENFTHVVIMKHPITPRKKLNGAPCGTTTKLLLRYSHYGRPCVIVRARGRRSGTAIAPVSVLASHCRLCDNVDG